MGSFNVSCSVSNLPITEGSDVAFLFLKPSQNYKIKNGKIPALSSFTYSDDLYQPVTLPIFAKYNDYGSIEDIVMDSNVKAIEAHFGITIYELVMIVNDGRDALDHNSEIFPVFNIDKLNYKISEENLLKNGFKLIDDNYVFQDNKFKLTLEADKKNPSYFNITVSNDYFSKEYRCLEDLMRLQRKLFEDFDFIISLPAEKQYLVSTIKKISKMSSMFINKDIYQTMINRNIDGVKSTKVNSNLSRSPHPIFFKALGFNISKSDEKFDDIYIMEKNGLVFQYEYQSVSFEDYNIYEMSKLFNVLEDNGFPEDENLIAGIDVFSEKVKFVIENLPYVDPALEDRQLANLKRMIRANALNKLKDLVLFNERWSDLLKIYSAPLSESDFGIVPLLDDFLDFCISMSSTNNMFMPMVSSGQCVDSKMLKIIYRKSFSLVSSLQEDDFTDSIVENYIYLKDIDRSVEYLSELIDDYNLKDLPSVTGLSLFEIKSFIKDKSVLKEILETYVS